MFTNVGLRVVLSSHFLLLRKLCLIYDLLLKDELQGCVSLRRTMGEQVPTGTAAWSPRSSSLTTLSTVPCSRVWAQHRLAALGVFPADSRVRTAVLTHSLRARAGGPHGTTALDPLTSIPSCPPSPQPLSGPQARCVSTGRPAPVGPRPGAPWAATAPLLSLTPKGLSAAGLGRDWGVSSAPSTLLSFPCSPRAGGAHPEHLAPMKVFSLLHRCSKFPPGHEGWTPSPAPCFSREVVSRLASPGMPAFPSWPLRQSAAHTGASPRGPLWEDSQTPLVVLRYYWLLPPRGRMGTGFLSCSTPALPKASGSGLPGSVTSKLVSVCPPPPAAVCLQLLCPSRGLVSCQLQGTSSFPSDTCLSPFSSAGVSLRSHPGALRLLLLFFCFCFTSPLTA